MVKMKMALPLCMLRRGRIVPETVGVLLSHGADVDGKDEDGFTALHFAARADASKAVEILLKHGADSDAKNDSGVTPLRLIGRVLRTLARNLLVR